MELSGWQFAHYPSNLDCGVSVYSMLVRIAPAKEKAHVVLVFNLRIAAVAWLVVGLLWWWVDAVLCVVPMLIGGPGA